ncbi:MAG: AsmA-like C-terminal region-containing protein [Limisphaera sp.]|nr:AsmA-like C-terminal region-containing protein [Limisphaera sp.]
MGSVSARELRVRGQWSAPMLQVPTFEGRLASGAVAGACTVDFGSEVARFELTSDADPFEVESFLSDRARRWLGQFRWQEPPRLSAAGTLRLPPWPAGTGAWAEALRTSLTMTGEVALGQGSFRGFAGDRARTHFSFSDGTWHFPDLEVDRSDGRIRADYRIRPWARDYHWRFVAALSPDACRPLLRSNQVAFLDLFGGTNVPWCEGEVWGRFLQPETVAGHGRLIWSNFVFRGVPIRLLDTRLAFSNQWLHAVQPRVEREGASLGAEGVALDFRQARVHLTNAVCQDDPATVAGAIGPKTATNLAPYRFEQPPRVWLNGTIPFRGTAGADLHAQIEGGPFRWWRFRSPRVMGRVHWLGEQVALTNVTAEFYGGRLTGWGVFDTTPAEGTDCRFSVEVSQVRMPDLMRDLSPSPRPLEGILDGWLEVTRANTRDWRTWNGQGEVRLRDGWIWSIPLFGILSEPLDALVPGLGRSPVTSGQATFVLTNGVILSDNLECRAATMRLLYNGRLSLEGEVDAVVQAELLRDAWLVGRVLSLALWPVSKIFEFHITGTLENPRAEPLHIPRVLTIPLRPVQTLRELLGAPAKEPKP